MAFMSLLNFFAEVWPKINQTFVFKTSWWLRAKFQKADIFPLFPVLNTLKTTGFLIFIGKFRGNSNSKVTRTHWESLALPY